MKQQVLCCLLLTISAGTCHTYGVKGSLSKSYSSSSAAASSSSFSSSFSSGEDADLNDIANSLKIGSQAGSAAFAQAGSDGAHSGSGAFAGSSSGAFSGASSGAFAGAGSGSYSKSGSYSGSGIQTGQSGSIGHSGSAGSYSGSGLQTGQSGSGHSGSDASYSGSGLQIGQSGSGHSGSAGSYSGSGSFSKTGSTCTSCSGSGEALVPAFGTGTDTKTGSFNAGYTTGQNQESVGHGSNLNQEDTKPKTVNTGYNSNVAAGGNTFVNDFQIPAEFQNHLTKPASHKNIQGSNSYNGANFGSYEGSTSKSKPCCQGPFPGPKGSIHDFKPAPPGGGGPPAWVPEEQKPTQPNIINTGYHQGATNTGSTGLSSHLIHSFPGSQGGIHDSKPVNNKPYHQGGSIPVSVIPVVVETPQYHQQPSQTHVPGSGASSVIGSLPGPTGSIHTSIPAGQKPTQPIFVQPNPSYGNKKPVPSQDIFVQPNPGYGNKKPVPSQDIINSFPGKPGNIYDNKPVSACSGGQCHSKGTVGVDLSQKPKVPDCSAGQCDEFGGKLGCHGDECFGPGKKPSYAHIAGSNANSNAHFGSGSINIDLSKPSIDGLCKSGKCKGPELVIVDIPPSEVPYVIEQKPYEKPVPGLVIVDVPPSNIPYVIEQKPIQIPSGSQQKPNQNVYPAPDSINFGVNQPTPTYPGTLCSGIDCLLPPLPGTKQYPSTTSNAGCSGAYCINIIPENPSCTGENCGNKVPNNQPKNTYQHSYSGSKSNAQASEGQEKVLIEQPITSSPSPVITESTTSEPYDKDSSHDFLLPGNKPPHHHKVNLHQPSLPKKQPEKTPGEGYYTCTGTSCPLPKHPGQITPHQTQNVPSPGQQGEISCSGAGCIPQSNVPEGYTGAGGHDRLYPGYNQGSAVHNTQSNCNGNACSTPQLKPFKIPDEYKGDSILGQKEQYPSVIPVVELQENNPAGSNGFVSGTVVVEKSEGVEIPVVDVLIPGGSQPGYSCSGSQCDGAKQTKDDRFTSGSNAGYYPGSSGGHVQENVQASGCLGGSCQKPLPSGNGGGCSNGKCGSNGGSYAGSTGGNLQSNFQGNGCSTGKCGADLNGGSSSGSGSFSGSGSYVGGGSIKTGESLHGNFHGSGCSSGKCGSNGGVSGSYASSTGGNLQQGNFQGSGCSTGKCGTDFNGGSSSGSGSYGGGNGGCKSGRCGGSSGAFSSSSSFSGAGSGSGSQSYATSGSGAGFEGFPLLKQLINQSIKGGDFHHPGSGAFSGASSYSGSGSSSHSSAFSSAGSFAAK